jgi:hypothetical protein
MTAVQLRASRRLLLFTFTFTFIATNVAACGDGGQGAGNTGGGGGTGAAGGGLGGNAFNQCGVAAPLPANTGQCVAVSAPALTDFDDYAGTSPASYTYYVNAKPPASGAVLGAIQHVGDGSDANGGTAVIATEMVTGASGAGYALQISNTNAMNWGGLLMFYFPAAGAGCLDARNYRGVEFSIRGASPSGRYGVSVGMLDVIPTADSGLCSNANADDCKPATIDFPLPADATLWTQVQVPWAAFTPGVGSALACVPVTGQNIVRLVIQPFMSYPPPDYRLAPGPYVIAVDNLRFY